MIGGLPSFDSEVIPIVSNAFKIGFIGRFLRLSSPVNIVFPPDNAATAIAILIVVPEFCASITDPLTVEPIVFLIVTISFSSCTSTPNDLHALIVLVFYFSYIRLFTYCHN